MNLDSLTSDLPKKWLHIQCDKLTANVVETPAGPVSTQAFSAYSNISVPLPGVSNSLPNTITIDNPNYDNNVASYTAPSAQFVQFTWQMVLQGIGGGATCQTQFFMSLNGITQIETLNRQTFQGNNATGTIYSSAIIRMAAGDVVTWTFTSGGVVGVWNVYPVSFSGVVI